VSAAAVEVLLRKLRFASAAAVELLGRKLRFASAAGRVTTYGAGGRA